MVPVRQHSIRSIAEQVISGYINTFPAPGWKVL
jgi:hypothetical protein